MNGNTLCKTCNCFVKDIKRHFKTQKHRLCLKCDVSFCNAHTDDRYIYKQTEDMFRRLDNGENLDIEENELIVALRENIIKNMN